MSNESASSDDICIRCLVKETRVFILFHDGVTRRGQSGKEKK